MKKILISAFLAAVLAITSGCGTAKDDTADNLPDASKAENSAIVEHEKDDPETDVTFDVPDTFSLTDFDFSEVKSVGINSMITGKSIIMTDSEDITSIIEAVRPLGGSNPISSRGYYGWSYVLEFYNAEAPDENSVPLLAFGLFDMNATETYLSTGVFEIVSGHRYSAMYPVDAALADAVENLCRSYVDN